MNAQTLQNPSILTGRPGKSALFAAFDRYKTYRRTVAELEACSDRDLSDLGIYRCDIRRIAKESIYGESA